MKIERPLRRIVAALETGEMSPASCFSWAGLALDALRQYCDLMGEAPVLPKALVVDAGIAQPIVVL